MNRKHLNDLVNLEGHLLAFESAWQTGQPAIADFLREVPVDYRSSALVELVLIDMEHRIRSQQTVTLDQYTTEFPELKEHSEQYRELARSEVDLRARFDRPICDTEISQRYAEQPELADAMHRHASSSGEETGTWNVEKLPAGTHIHQYVLGDVIGSGAFSVVYRARDDQLGRDVALKFLKSAKGMREHLHARMIREARAQAAMHHNNIVPVFEINTFQGHAFIVNQLITGQSLEEFLAGNSLSIEESLELTALLADSLEHAHQVGVVHRDIKPANIMLEQETGKPMIVDFGLAQLADSSQLLTHEGDMVGTPAYMSPEQADGRAWQSDPRSDVYSLGAVLYRLICGRLPFQGSVPAVVNQVLHRAPAKPQLLNSKISRDLQELTLKCLEKEPGFRYQSAALLLDDLKRIMAGQSLLGRRIGRTHRLLRWSRLHPVLATFALAFCALILFSSGIASQLFRVSKEKQRAELAEDRMHTMFANSSVDAGSLAMQRGQIAKAIERFQVALESEYPDATELLLRLVEANFILGNRREANQLLKKAMQNPGQHMPLVTQWQLELSLDGDPDFEEPERLLAEVVSLTHSNADTTYIAGLASQSTPEAISWYYQTIDVDPFHYRARRNLMISLLSMMRFSEVADQVRISIELFPDSRDFRLLAALNCGFQQNLSDAQAHLAACKMPDDLNDKWLEFCQFAFSLRTIVDEESSNGDLNPVSLTGNFQHFAENFLPLVSDRQWHLPLAVEKQLSEFTDQMTPLHSIEGDEAVAALASLVAAHPEPSLQLLLGNAFISSFRAADSRESAIEQLERAKDLYSSAIAAEGFLQGTALYARKGVFATAVALALVQKHKIPENLADCMQVSQYIPVEAITSPPSIKAFAIAALTADDRTQALRWLDRWVAVTLDDHEMQASALWHRAILAQRNENWLLVLKHCDAIAAIDPEFPELSGMRDRALLETRKLIQKNPDGNNDGDDNG